MENFDLSALLPALTCNGQTVSAAAWDCTVVAAGETDAGRRTVREFTAPDGLLKIRVTMLAYRDFPAVRYIPEIIGCGDQDSALIEAFHSLDLTCPLPAAEAAVRATTGSQNHPCDFSARHFVLSGIEGQNRLELICDEGRSSGNWMPYVGIDLTPDEGLEIAIGWSGSWRLTCGIGPAADHPGELRCRFGMSNFAARVRPGETLRQPSVLILQRKDMNAAAFQTVIHDFMVAHNSPRDSRGEILKPILPVTVSGGNRRPEEMQKVIDYTVRAGLPADAVWVDAGWYGPEHTPDARYNCGDCWAKYVGDWRVNTGVHPSGSLKGISDAAHAAGMRFLLWMEPERVTRFVPILQEHPEYARSVNDDTGLANLLDLGNPGAWQWIFESICRTIEENGVDIYRQDFNMDPAPVWAAFDEPERRGVNEIRHITGLYRLWDALREKYPDMLIDNCASGGRRLDFELTARSHSYCRSDYSIPRPGNLPRFSYTAERHRYQIVMGQNATLNTLAWVPFQGGEANAANWFDDGEIFSLLAAGIVFTLPDWDGGCIRREFTAAETDWFRKMFAVANRVRRLLTGRFHPLTQPRTLDETVWAGYECVQPETGEGFAAFFRRSGAGPTRVFTLRDIDDSAEYEITDASTGTVSRIAGCDLHHFTVTLDKAPDGSIVFFRRV
ncbi:MAG: alpha-galactosidase [Lentisphaeria bacterium]|nr:alpha-galactosidase [Lentisphaeria bacterium]